MACSDLFIAVSVVEVKQLSTFAFQTIQYDVNVYR